jgi:hypothetical protein
MQTFWKVALGSTVVAALGAGSAGAVALTSALTITDQPGLVQQIDPVSTGSDSSPTAEETASGVAPTATPAPTSTAPVDVPVAPPVAVPPAGAQTIDDDAEDVDVDVEDAEDVVDVEDAEDADVDDVDD